VEEWGRDGVKIPMDHTAVGVQLYMHVDSHSLGRHAAPSYCSTDLFALCSSCRQLPNQAVGVQLYMHVGFHSLGRHAALSYCSTDLFALCSSCRQLPNQAVGHPGPRAAIIHRVVYRLLMLATPNCSQSSKHISTIQIAPKFAIAGVTAG